MTQNDPNQTWARDAVFIRMTKRRKAKLVAIAQDMAETATPSDAIERAIDLASSGGLSSSECLSDRLASFQETLDQLVAERRRDTERTDAAISAAMRSSQEVLDLLHEVAAQGGED